MGTPAADASFSASAAAVRSASASITGLSVCPSTVRNPGVPVFGTHSVVSFAHWPHALGMGIYRLGHVEVRTPDLDLCTAYYTEVLGLRETARDDEHVWLKCWDEHDHHSVILTSAPRFGVERIAWKTESDDDLAEYETRLERYGCRVQRIPARAELAVGEAIRFDTPSGHVMDIYSHMDKVGNGLPQFNPPPMPIDLIGIAPPRLDHCLLTTEHVPDAARFMQEALGFRLTEQLINGEGHQLIAFLERSRSPHDVAFSRGPDGGLHHFSFWLDSWADVGRAADILRLNG